ncbi:MAG: virulence RhuM family protein [Bacteroidota bacterium]|nr:virulence RhuM family protein [Bacteroidota bacterium]
MFDNELESTKNFVLYTTPNGEVKLEVFIQDETLWLTQKAIATLLGVEVPAISKHLRNIFKSGELVENSVVSILEITASDGKNYKTTFYNLDAIISVGYRVNSSKATQFRIWATQVLKEYIIKGFAMNDARLKQGDKAFGKDYFRELLERVRSIRTSERRIYQQITDIFAECSIDYDPNSEITHHFYATVQNKFHYAITKQTAAELIFDKASHSQPFMGLSTWKNAPAGRILPSDVIVAKNYLLEKEIKKLERTITGFFDYIENVIENENALTMNDMIVDVDSFLNFNKFEVLKGKGKISKKEADEKALKEYSGYNKIQPIESDFDRIVKKLEKE